MVTWALPLSGLPSLALGFSGRSGGCGPPATGLRSWLCDAEFVLHDLTVQKTLYRIEIKTLRCGQIWLGEIDSMARSTAYGVSLLLDVATLGFVWRAGLCPLAPHTRPCRPPAHPTQPTVAAAPTPSTGARSASRAAATPR